MEDNVKLDLWSRQLMPSQSTEHKKSCHSQTRLVCVRCCALVNSFFQYSHCDNLSLVTTSPGLPYIFPVQFPFNNMKITVTSSIPVFDWSHLGQRVNSLHTLEINAVYRNPRFWSTLLEIYQWWGSRKRNYLTQLIFESRSSLFRNLNYQIFYKEIILDEFNKQ